MKRYILFTLALICLFMTLTCMPAALHAQISATNKEEAARLETVLNGLLQDYQNAAEMRGGQLQADGPVLVEKADDFYAATLPVLTYINANGARTEIGMIALNLQPGTAAGKWKMTMALPSPIISYDAADKPVITTQIDQQHFSGIWDENFEGFTKLSARYNNITFKNHADAVDITIPALTLSSDISENDERRWSGAAQMQLSSLIMAPHKSGGPTVESGTITIRSAVDDYAPQAAQSHRETLEALAENAQSETAENISTQHMAGLLNLLSGFMSKTWNGFSFSFDLNDLHVTWPAAEIGGTGQEEKEKTFTRIALGNAQAALSMSGFRADDVGSRIQIGYKGLEAGPLPGNLTDLSALMPENFDIELNLKHLPYQKIIALGSQILRAQSADENKSLSPAEQEAARQKAMARIPAYLTEAGTSLTIKNLIASPHYNFQTDATLTANHNAAHGYTGTGHMRVQGFDFLTDHIKKAMNGQNISKERRLRLQQILATLTVLQIAGQPGNDENGQTFRTYELTLDQDGNTQLNGADLSALLPRPEKEEETAAP